MFKRVGATESKAPTSTGQARAVATFGYWTALGAGLTTLVTLGIAVSTPSLSGPFCRTACIDYPYLDIAGRFPRDYYWMFPAMAAMLFYVALVVGMSSRAAAGARPLAQLGVCLAVMAAIIIESTYFVQVSVIQPSVVAGEADGISLLTQYNPHGVFIALEELGYLLMSLSLACMASVLSSSALERAIKWLFVGGLGANVVALTWILVRYGHGRAYLFEVFIISVDYLVLIIGAFLLAVVYRRAIVSPTISERA